MFIIRGILAWFRNLFAGLEESTKPRWDKLTVGTDVSVVGETFTITGIWVYREGSFTAREYVLKPYGTFNSDPIQHLEVFREDGVLNVVHYHVEISSDSLPFTPTVNGNWPRTFQLGNETYNLIESAPMIAEYLGSGEPMYPGRYGDYRAKASPKRRLSIESYETRGDHPEVEVWLGVEIDEIGIKVLD